MSSYDLAVIGAGSAGFSAAITAAESGARVALIGDGMIGGTCVNVGCVPSKTLIRAMQGVHDARTAGRFGGIHSRAAVEDWGAVVAAKDELVSSLRQAKYTGLLPDYETMDYLYGPARLTGDGVLVDGQNIAAPKVIIATGSRPAPPAIPGIADVPWLDSTAALAMRRLPESMLVAGAGFIGCELAQMFSRAGVTVTLVCRSRLLPQAEPEISQALARCLIDEGIDLHEGVTYRSVSRNGGGVSLEVDDGVILRAGLLVGAAGRIANTDGLGLAALEIETVGNGGIAVDPRMQTTRPGVYAVGDVTGRDMYVYMAAHGGRVAALNALDGEGEAAAYDDSAIPQVVFTDPQVASVGLTEAEARTKMRTVETSVLPLDQLPRALAARDTRGLIKLVADGDTDRLVGAHIMAPEGGDSIQTAALAIRQGMSVRDLARMVFPYLTTVEGLKLAAQGFERDVTKLSCCAG